MALITANNLVSVHWSIHSLIRYKATGVGLILISLPLRSIIFLFRYFSITCSKSCTNTLLSLLIDVMHFVVATNSNSLCSSPSNPIKLKRESVRIIFLSSEFSFVSRILFINAASLTTPIGSPFLKPSPSSCAIIGMPPANVRSFSLSSGL